MAQTTTRRTNRLDAATAAYLTVPPLFWAGNAVVGRLAVGSIGPVTLNFARWMLAALVLAPFVAATVWRNWSVCRAARRDLVLLSFFGVGCYNSFQYLALRTSSPINTTLIGASGPVFVLAVGAILFGERIRPRQIAGAVVSLAGVLLVMIRGDLGRLARIDFTPGDLWMLVATATWSIYTWLLRRRRPALPALPLLWIQMVLGAAMVLPIAAIESTVGAMPIVAHTKLVASLAYVVLFPSLLAYACWDRGVARAGAQLPIFFQNLTPVFAAVLSAWLLGESPHLFHLAGLILILAGIRLASRS